jgi:hypothetical protein
MGNPSSSDAGALLRLTIMAVLVCLLVTGYQRVPLGEAARHTHRLSAAVRFSGAQQTESYHWYVTRAGDDLFSVAERFNVQVGGIIELNNLPIGQDLAIGKAYKIPNDPFYGQNYRPANPYPVTGNGSTTFGNDWWDSYLRHLP